MYDVSGFIKQHPGGVDQLLMGAGRDVTILFESYHKPKIRKLVALQNYDCTSSMGWLVIAIQGSGEVLCWRVNI